MKQNKEPTNKNMMDMIMGVINKNPSLKAEIEHNLSMQDIEAEAIHDEEHDRS